MTEDEIAGVAASLSRDQRFAIEVAAECKGGKWWTTYGYLIRDTSLARNGELTDLGVAVKAHLQRTQGER
jgi:hypothetical protein